MKSHHPYQSRPIRVIHTKGTDREIGRQHAEILGDEIRQGMTKFYYDFWSRMLATKREGLLENAAFQVGKWFVDPFLVKQLSKQVPSFLSDRLLGISETSGISIKTLETTLVLPDLMPLLQSYLGIVRPSALIEASAPPRLGCTSFVINARSFYQGRNLDFPGVGYWDRFPIIQLIEPENSLRYLAFSSAGVPFGGITGINEAQVMVALHQHYSKSTSLSGQLPFAISERILMEAKTLQEAKEILLESQVAAAWAFVISDGKTGEAFLFECDASTCGIKELKDKDDTIAHANFFQTKGCQKSEYATTARMNWDNYWRKTRLEQLISERLPDIGPEHAVKFLSDHFDPYWQEEKIINRTVSQVYNLQSLVVDLKGMTAYMAEGDCPIHLRNYREFDLGEIFAKRNGETGRVLAPYDFKSEEKKKAKEAYILSFVAAFDGEDEKAKERIAVSLDHDFCAESALVASVLLLKTGEEKKAVELLRKAKNFTEEKKGQMGRDFFPPEYFEICLFYARALDLLGEREKALENYRRLASHQDLEDANVRSLALAKGPYTRKKLARILTPFSSYIPFE